MYVPMRTMVVSPPPSLDCMDCMLLLWARPSDVELDPHETKINMRVLQAMYCSGHREGDMVDVVYKRCEYPGGCEKVGV